MEPSARDRSSLAVLGSPSVALLGVRVAGVVSCQVPPVPLFPARFPLSTALALDLAL